MALPVIENLITARPSEVRYGGIGNGFPVIEVSSPLDKIISGIFRDVRAALSLLWLFASVIIETR